jgi:uncharacterized protein
MRNGMAGCAPLVNKFAFFPSTGDALSSYTLPEGVRELFIKTDDGESLQCYHLQSSGSRHLCIYFHGNGGNIGQRLPELLRFREFGISTLGVGYRGYGKSSGRPSEQGIYRDGRAAFRFALDNLRYTPDRIVLCGRSIGSTVALSTAIEADPRGCILITPLTTGKAYARAHGLGFFSFLTGNAFDNLSRCGRLRCPALVIHGTGDHVTPFYMGRQIYERISSEKRFVEIPGGDHNNLESAGPLYWESIRDFLQHLFPGSPAGSPLHP